jgi:hypothetical protein
MRKHIFVMTAIIVLSLVITGSSENPCPPIYQWNGTESGDLLGVRLDNIGDINNDGYDDIGIISPGSSGRISLGKVFIYSGFDGSLMYEITGASAVPSPIGGVSGIDDLNKDGYGDFIIGAPDVDPGGLLYAGQVYIFYGGPGPHPLYKITTEADIIIDGTIFKDGFGENVLGVGDINDDTFPDFAVVSLQWNSIQSGKIHVISGQTLDTLITLMAENVGDAFGHIIQLAGDVNGDGIMDIIVGAPLHDAGGLDAGAAYVFSLEDGALLYKYVGISPEEYFGTFPNGIGDVNNDGFDDVFVQNYLDDYNDSADAGSAYIFLGNDDPTPQTLTANEADYQFHGSNEQDRLGYFACGVGDVNGDDKDEIAIGAYRYFSDLPGVVYIISVQDGIILQTINGDAPHEAFGCCVSNYPDRNGDGINEIVIGARFMYDEHYPGAPEPGKAYLYSLGDGDNDGFWNSCDACPGYDDNDDSDGDSVPDSCDICQGYNDNDDFDGDTVPDSCDNCPQTANPGQEDSNDNDIGDACDYICGDANSDEDVNVSDAVYIINYVFVGGDAPDPLESGDVNCDDTCNVSDAVWIINYVFVGGNEPCDTSGDSIPDC